MFECRPLFASKHELICSMLCFVGRAYRYIHFKKNQLDAQFIFSIVLPTPVHVSGVSTAHHQEVHRMDTIGAYTIILFR